MMTRSDNAPRAVILGLGKTGYSCAKFLLNQGYDIMVMDSRAQPPMASALRELDSNVPVYTGGFDVQLLDECELVAVSPGIANDEPIVRAAFDRGLDVIGDVELFARSVTSPVVAITGSNGKSTVTALTGELLKAAGKNAAVGGNIGTPILDLLEQGDADVCVVELSSFQLELTSSLKPVCATVLNISADHMDRYASLQDYAAAKARIFQNASMVLVNRDDVIVQNMIEGETGISFGCDAPLNQNDYGVMHIDGESCLVCGDRILMLLDDIPLPGLHGKMNVLAAIALAESTGVQCDDAMRHAIATFEGLPHRMEIVGEWNGVQWINDSKGTNVGATVAALTGFDGPVILIAGGLGKDADFTPLRDACAHSASAVVLFGQDADTIENAIAGSSVIHRVDNLAAAIEKAKSLAKSANVVLFSPACASFDMFDNFEQRGDVFRQLVSEMQAS